MTRVLKNLQTLIEKLREGHTIYRWMDLIILFYPVSV